MAQIDGAGQQDTDNQNAEALQAALAQREVTLQGQPQGGSDVPSHENSDPVSDESEILRSRQPLTGKRRVPWRSRTEGLHGRSRVGGSAPALCQRARCYQSRPWDLLGGLRGALPRGLPEALSRGIPGWQGPGRRVKERFSEAAREDRPRDGARESDGIRPMLLLMNLWNGTGRGESRGTTPGVRPMGHDGRGQPAAARGPDQAAEGAR